MSSVQGLASASPEAIQAMVLERKMEKKIKAEEKRQKDLRRIADMKSCEGIHPLESFPKEIWDKILHEVGCEDQGKMRRVHNLFQDLTDATKVRDILFPQVLKVPHFKKLIEQEYSVQDEYDDELPISTTNYSPLRLVSKTVRNVIDKMQEDDLLQKMYDMETGYEASYKSFPILQLYLSFDYDDERKLDQISSNFSGENPAKRVFTRSLYIGLDDLNYCNEGDQNMQRERALASLARLESKIVALLEMIGTQIWNFTFSANHKDGQVEAACSLLRTLANLMPNLKRLKFKSCSGWGCEDGSRRREVMAACIGNYPFPRLKFLENFEVKAKSAHDESSLVVENVLLANPQITYICLNFGRKLLPLLPVDYSSASERLKSLDLVGFRASRFRGIEEIMNFNWKPKVINLNMKDAGITLKPLFELLGHFPTLEKVKLDNVRIPEHGDVDFLQLPNLSEFRFLALCYPASGMNLDYESNLLRFLLSLQFLLHCKNLRKLRWELWSDCFEELGNYMIHHETMLNFRAGMRVLHYSNIWKVFQNLDTVYVGLGNEKGCGMSQRSISSRNEEPDCIHEYRRAEICERMSVKKFFSGHGCDDTSYRHRCPLMMEPMEDYDYDSEDED